MVNPPPWIIHAKQQTSVRFDEFLEALLTDRCRLWLLWQVDVNMTASSFRVVDGFEEDTVCTFWHCGGCRSTRKVSDTS
jgi:hypothetical protein